MNIPVLAAGSVFDPLYNALGSVLAFLYALIPNLGVAIILLTLVIMLVLYPLTAKQAKSMLAMQRVQPEIKKLQAKYKGDRQKLNEEVMKFYQENKINPLAGCLPLVVQLPVFFTLFRVLRDPFKHIPKTGSFNSLYTKFCTGYGELSHGQWSLCGKTLTKATVVNGHSFPKNTQLLHHLTFLGIDLQKTATDSHSGALGAAPYFLLVGLVVLTGWLQTRQAQSRTPAANKQMATVMKILPVFFGLISLQFPAGLVLYFFVSNLFRVGQQELIFRRIGTIHSPPTAGKLGSGAKRDAIDVASKERDEPEPAAAPDGESDTGSTPATRSAAKSPQRSNPRREPRPARPARETRGPATPPAGRGRGGLRAMFQLPPPPDGNGGRPPSSGSKPTPGGSTRSGGGAGGPSRAARPSGQQPRRRNPKKKRKR